MIKETNDPNGGAPRTADDDGVFDVVVVGAGAAGLNAALLLGRARRKVVVIDAGEPRNAPAAHMYGFLSRDGLAPATLLELGHAEIARYGVRLIQGRVDQIDHGYDVRMVGGPVLKARRVLVATGLRDELPDIPGVRERWGKDLLHCPYCHAYEVRDRPLAVLGTHPGAVHQALLLRAWSDDVVFFEHTLELTAGPGAAGGARPAHRRGRGQAPGRRRRPAARYRTHRRSHRPPRRGLPLPPHVPRDELLTQLGCAKDEVITAAGMGSAAAFAINTDLLDEDVDHAIEQRRATAAATVAGDGR